MGDYLATIQKPHTVYDLTPSNPLLTENPPFIGFSLLDETLSKHINCFIYDFKADFPALEKTDMKLFVFGFQI